jgi:hypothetical protein
MRLTGPSCIETVHNKAAPVWTTPSRRAAGNPPYHQTIPVAQELHRGLYQMVFEIMEAHNGQLTNFDDDVYPSG